jgi:hypothetical protein
VKHRAWAWREVVARLGAAFEVADYNAGIASSSCARSTRSDGLTTASLRTNVAVEVDIKAVVGLVAERFRQLNASPTTLAIGGSGRPDHGSAREDSDYTST